MMFSQGETAYKGSLQPFTATSILSQKLRLLFSVQFNPSRGADSKTHIPKAFKTQFLLMAFGTKVLKADNTDILFPHLYLSKMDI